MEAVATRSSKTPWKVISGDELDRAEQWRPPSLSDPHAPAAHRPGHARPQAERNPEDVAALDAGLPTLEQIEAIGRRSGQSPPHGLDELRRMLEDDRVLFGNVPITLLEQGRPRAQNAFSMRSEESRVGKESRYRWSPYH